MPETDCDSLLFFALFMSLVGNLYQYFYPIKNVTGNVLTDDELLSLTLLDQKVFRKKLRNIFQLKKEDRVKLIGSDENNEIEKKLLLQIIDFTWRSHLQYLEQLRQVIGLRSYGQKDPLSEFKKEAFLLFEELLEKIKIDIIKFLLNLNIVFSENKSEEKIENNQLGKSQKVGRNDKCPCGSGKKYKHCCGSI